MRRLEKLNEREGNEREKLIAQSRVRVEESEHKRELIQRPFLRQEDEGLVPLGLTAMQWVALSRQGAGWIGTGQDGAARCTATDHVVEQATSGDEVWSSPLAALD